VDERADVYALGCTAYELLTGQLLFQERNLGALITAKVCFDLPASEDIRSGLSDDLYDLLKRCLALDIKARNFRPAEILHWAAPLDPTLLPKPGDDPTDPDSSTRTHFS
jgi:serine/threonine protein kinase